MRDRDTPAAPPQPGVPTGAGGVTAGTESRAGAGAGCMRVAGEQGDSGVSGACRLPGLGGSRRGRIRARRAG